MGNGTLGYGVLHFLSHTFFKCGIDGSLYTNYPILKIISRTFGNVNVSLLILSPAYAFSSTLIRLDRLIKFYCKPMRIFNIFFIISSIIPLLVPTF